jgi:threonine aldolase
VTEARVWRKRFGAGWRQAGPLAAAGLYALDHHIERLADDHEHARLIAEAAGVDPATVDTNIVIFDTPNAPEFMDACEREGVQVTDLSTRTVRVCTHLDVSRSDAEKAAAVIGRLLAQ